MYKNNQIMDIYKHCLLSQRKFGGQPEDYEQVHAFIDSSKYFYYHAKHRMLLHNLYGVSLATELCGNFLTNSDRQTLLVRDIAVEHCREDLDGHIPTLSGWFKGNQNLADLLPQIPNLASDVLNEFIWRPYLQTGIKATLIITCSDFGIQLMKQFYGYESARKLRQALPEHAAINLFLKQFRFGARWQYTPQKAEIKWLKQYQDERKYQNHVEGILSAS